MRLLLLLSSLLLFSPVLADLVTFNDSGLALIINFIATPLIELLIAYLFLNFVLKIKKGLKRLLIAIIVANVCSLTVAMSSLFLFYFYVDLITLFFLIEIMVFVFEAYLISFLNKKVITLKQSLKLSAVMNASTVLISIIVMVFSIT